MQLTALRVIRFSQPPVDVSVFNIFSALIRSGLFLVDWRLTLAEVRIWRAGETEPGIELKGN